LRQRVLENCSFGLQPERLTVLDPQAAANALTASRCSTSSASTNQRWPGPKVNLKDVGVFLPHKGDAQTSAYFDAGGTALIRFPHILGRDWTGRMTPSGVVNFRPTHHKDAFANEFNIGR
jgi:hypothetical protein